MLKDLSVVRAQYQYPHHNYLYFHNLFIFFSIIALEDPLEREGPLPLNVTLHDILNIELGSEIT